MSQPDFIALYQSPSFRYYARIKLATDPVYGAVHERLRDTALPVLDIGCGLGLLSFYLRSRGLTVPITGVDFDSRKVDAARRIAERYENLSFETADARAAVSGFSGNVVLLDILHYFTDSEQAGILGAAADRVPAGGMVVIRDCLRDASWRYRLTHLEETFATSIRWIKAERLHFPTLSGIAGEFRQRGFSEEIVPMWGRTPFNNYLLTFRRP